MSDTLYKFLQGNVKNSDYIYEERHIKKCVILWSRGRKERDKEYAKNFLYNVLSKIIVKNVNNFFNLLTRTGDENQHIYSADDLVSECYLILETCVHKCKLHKCRSFMWYYNKSLSNGLYRIAGKAKKKNKHFVKQKNADLDLYDSMGFYKEKPHEMVYNDFGLKGWERQFLLSIRKGETSRDFKEKFKMDNIRFNSIVSSVRQKLEEHYAEISE